MEMPVDKEMCSKKIEELGFKNPDGLYEYCHKKGIYTIGDYVNNYKKVNKKYGNLIKSVLFFEIDLTDPDVYEYE